MVSDGGAAARTLLDAGLSVRAVMRDAAKGAAWKERGCEIALADMKDAAALAAALSGVDGVFVMIPPPELAARVIVTAKSGVMGRIVPNRSAFRKRNRSSEFNRTERGHRKN